MKFTAVFLLTLVVLGAVYAAGTLLVDPRREFGTGVIPPVAIDIRADKVKLFKQYQAAGPVEGLVLGSSRSMNLRPEDLKAKTGLRFFNFGVNSGQAEDYLAIYRWVRQRGSRPKSVLIGLDVEALHDHAPLPWQLLANEPLRSALQSAAAPPPDSRVRKIKKTLGKVKGIYSVSYLDDTSRSLVGHFVPHATIRKIEPDGVMSYPEWEWERRHRVFNLDEHIKASSVEYEERYGKMSGLSEERKGYLETTIREALADGAKVVIWITPMHPREAQHMAEKTRYRDLVRMTSDYLRELSARYGIAAYDFSDPATFGGTLTGWYDGAHADPSNGARIIERVLGKA